MPKISVIFVTNRFHCMEILKDDMERQTFRDFEVIVADDQLGNPARGHTPMPRTTYFKPRQKEKGDVWNINKAYNDAVNRARGELLVFLQDFIWIPSYGLERFWESYKMFPNALVTGVGHKAQKGLEGISEVDNRVFGDDEFPVVNWSYWELNWSSCPSAFMPSFNEEMDQFYGGENHYIAFTANQKGHPIVIDRRNQCIGYAQEQCGGRPKNWDAMHYNKNHGFDRFVLKSK